MSDDPFDDFEDDPFADEEDSDPFADADDADRQDPFADADDADEADRGDPFDDIEADIPEEATDEASLFEEGDSGDRTVPEDPFTDPDVGGEASSTDPSGRGEDPFEGFETPDGDPFSDLDSGSSDLDDSVWEDLSAEQDAEPLSEQQAGKRISEVSKHRFCEQCPHFSGPPEISCSHEGTEILEFLDYETVRLADCPVVAEREALENMQ